MTQHDPQALQNRIARLNEMIGFIPIKDALECWKENYSLATVHEQGTTYQPLLPQPRHQPFMAPELYSQLQAAARTPQDSPLALRKRYKEIMKSFDFGLYKTTCRLNSGFQAFLKMHWMARANDHLVKCFMSSHQPLLRWKALLRDALWKLKYNQTYEKLKIRVRTNTHRRATESRAVSTLQRGKIVSPAGEEPFAPEYLEAQGITMARFREVVSNMIDHPSQSLFNDEERQVAEALVRDLESLKQRDLHIAIMILAEKVLHSHNELLKTDEGPDREELIARHPWQILDDHLDVLLRAGGISTVCPLDSERQQELKVHCCGIEGCAEPAICMDPCEMILHEDGSSTPSVDKSSSHVGYRCMGHILRGRLDLNGNDSLSRHCFLQAMIEYLEALSVKDPDYPNKIGAPWYLRAKNRDLMHVVTPNVIVSESDADKVRLLMH